ncbi:MAG TPA: Maf family protein [Acidimicrobiia bacterium]|nr:Maf family protein [Acidimicrobiia bacterium]
MRLVLASGSPRRRILLETLRLDFDVEAAEVDETRLPDEPPGVYVERVARAKAGSVAGPDRLVVAADTTVVHEGRVMGKPAHPEEARSILRRLQGETHEVFTGLAVAWWEGSPSIQALVDVTMVEMVPMTEGEIVDYVASGEPMDKAGAYALQGIGGVYVRRVIGSPFTVIGLPIHLLDRLMSAVGARLSQFRLPDRG